jgi:drug/metabolite transporter (DMT)-like permease
MIIYSILRCQMGEIPLERSHWMMMQCAMVWVSPEAARNFTFAFFSFFLFFFAFKLFFPSERRGGRDGMW